MLTDKELAEVFDEMRLNEVMYMDRKSEDQTKLKEAVDAIKPVKKTEQKK